VFRPSIVQFRLPLTPPQGMEMPPKPTPLYHHVGTTELAPEALKVNQSACRWKKADLDLLGVNYQYDVCDDIRIGVDDGEMPSELLQSIRLVTNGLI
jgi:hypothetical protein